MKGWASLKMSKMRFKFKLFNQIYQLKEILFTLTHCRTP